MPNNDQLTRLERVRLESLAQALRCPIENVQGADEAMFLYLRRAEQIER